MATPKKVDMKKDTRPVRLQDEDDGARIGNPASDELDEDLTMETDVDPDADTDEKE